MTGFLQILQKYPFNTNKHISIVFTQGEQCQKCVFLKSTMHRHQKSSRVGGKREITLSNHFLLNIKLRWDTYCDQHIQITFPQELKLKLYCISDSWGHKEREALCWCNIFILFENSIMSPYNYSEKDDRTLNQKTSMHLLPQSRHTGHWFKAFFNDK